MIVTSNFKIAGHLPRATVGPGEPGEIDEEGEVRGERRCKTMTPS
jgi:hypothetical protein